MRLFIVLTLFLSSLVLTSCVPANLSSLKDETVKAVKLDTITNRTITEDNTLIIDANDGGDDFTTNLEDITYTCHYDMVIDQSVSKLSACDTLANLTFSPSTGILNWTPDSSQISTYEFLITASASLITDEEIFTITVRGTNNPPVLDPIPNHAVVEGGRVVVNAGENGTDFDSDADPIIFSCFYNNTSCSSGLTGVSFNANSGIFLWGPDYNQTGTYQITIRATDTFDQSLYDEQQFTIDVTNNNRTPILSAVADQLGVNENVSITTIDINDSNTGTDLDIDGESITYSCQYDMAINGVFDSAQSCSTLTGLSFNANTGVISWTPDYTQSGNYEFFINGSDGVLTSQDINFSITVNNVNKAPVIDDIADQTISEGQSLTTIDATDGGDDLDLDGTAITYSCYYDTTLDSSVSNNDLCTILGASFDTSTGILNWTPSYIQQGGYEFKITGSDGPLSDDEIFSINVTNINSEPILESIANQTVAENSSINQIDANDGGDDFDRDNSSLTYSCYYDMVIDGVVASSSSCTSLGITFNTSTGVMDWTPDYHHAGLYEFIIIATDGTLQDEKVFTITVTNINRPPVLSPINDLFVAKGDAINQVDANDDGDDYDKDSEAISYSCYYDTTIDSTVDEHTANSCLTLAGASFNQLTGRLYWSTDSGQVNTYEFKIIGSDGSLSDSQIFTIAVLNSNTAPLLDSIANQEIIKENAIAQINAADGGDDLDADGHTILYSCHYDIVIDGTVLDSNDCSSLTGVTFNTTTGLMDWTPNSSQDGSYEFKITGTDGSLSDDEIFTITVTNSNRPPALDLITNQEVTASSAIAQIDANDGGDDFDRDGTALTYSCYYDTTNDQNVSPVNSCDDLAGISFNTGTGTIDWTPSSDQIGFYEFVIIATDNLLTGNTLFSITVKRFNNPPTLDTIADQSGAVEGSPISTINAGDSGDDYDSDSDPITYTCYYDTVGNGSVSNTDECTSLNNLFFNTLTGVIEWTPDDTQAGTYEFKITGSDGELADSEIFVITVSN